MELKHYAGMIIRRWRLAGGAFAATLLLTALLVSRQPWIYEATTTFVIRPSPAFNEAADDFVRAMDTLSRHTDINATFSQVATSKVVKQQAIERLQLSDEERKGLQVSGAAVAGSNILEITVRGPQPGVVRDMADAVGLETTNLMGELYDVFVLEQLDAASLPSRPVSPNRVLTMAVGAMLGLMLGVGLVFLGEYLQEPAGTESSFNIIDGESGLYNRDYFFLRLDQEISRSENSEHIFSLALIKLKSRRLATGVSHTIPGGKAAPALMMALASKLRKEDVLARVDDDLFALLLPAMSREATDGLLRPLEEQARSYMGGRAIENDRALGSGAITDVAAVALTVASARASESAEALFEQAVELMAEKEASRQSEMPNSGEDVSGLLFLPGSEEKVKSRTAARGNGRKKSGR